MTQNGSTPTVLLTPLKSALIAGHDQRLPVLVRIQAPDADPAQVKVRPPYHLALVIDRSGSMSGDPLEEAKRCAGYIIDQLEATDRAALVLFDSHVELLAPARPVGDRKALQAALAGIDAGGTTDLHGGWRAGADALVEFARESGLSRVILLSDGNANSGLCDPREIAAQCGALAGQGVTTSTYGLGRGFNEELMVAMAKAGQGNHYYGETARDLFEPFAEEFDLIANLYARGLRLSLGASKGVQADVLNDYPMDTHRGSPQARLPDLTWGAEAWALVELKVPAPRNGELVALLQVEVTGMDLEGKPLAFPPAELKVMAVSQDMWDALLPDALVRQRLHELEAARLLEQARTAAQQGDWQAIERLLDNARQRFADNPWLQQVLVSMLDLARMQDQARFSKEAMFSTLRMRSRLSAKEEAVSLSQEADSPSYLRRKSAQGKAQFRRGPDKDHSA